MKYILGSAQFGSNYGIANKSGKVNFAEALKILSTAKSFKIDTIDTARSYGNSENILGRIANKNWKIITKIPKLESIHIGIDKWLNISFEESKNNLKSESIHAILFHSSKDLFQHDKLLLQKALESFKNKHEKIKIGVSVYHPEEVKKLNLIYPFDIYQMPINIFDKRFLSNELEDIKNKNNCEFHGRSVFLQGLLLMDKDSQYKLFPNHFEIWDKWHDYLSQNKISGIEACMIFINKVNNIDSCVIGVDTAKQLSEIFSVNLENKDDYEDIKFSVPEKILLPNLW